MTEIQPQEMKGRTRLKGVLDGLVQQIKEEKDGEVLIVDEEVEEAARDLLELNDDGSNFNIPRKRPRSVRSPTRRKGGRKRVCKEVYYQSPNDSENSDLEESHIPHVMTLFDRRVDLARFSPDTPLYVMCREWMCNNPHKLFLDKPLYDSTQPSKPLPPTPPPNTLPLPTPLSRDSKGVVIRLDIPKPHPPHTKAREELDVILHRCFSGLVTNMSELKSAQLQRWRSVRSSWRHASSLNQARYAESFARIKDMFQR